MRVDKARHTSHTGEAVVHDPFENLGEGPKKHDDAEGGWGVVGGLAWLVQNYAIGFLSGGRVETVGNQGGEEVEDERRGDLVDSFPHRVGDGVRAQGRRW